jgi:hypothetical protein
LREEAMTGKASDFPTLALSRSGNTGISQPSTKKGTPSQINQLFVINLCNQSAIRILMPDEKIVNAKSGFQNHCQSDAALLFIKSLSFEALFALLLFKIITSVKSVFSAYTAAWHSNKLCPDRERPFE